MKSKILINGIGRIGKSILKQILKKDDLEIVAINDINPYIQNIAYSINYDSTYGKIKDKFMVEDNYIKNYRHKIKVLNHSSIFDIDLSNIDYIIDSSGIKNDKKKLRQLDVKATFVTHPTLNSDINMILGVNEDKLNTNLHKVISTSSCNATALLPVLKIIDDEKQILCGDIITVHPLLNHQRVLDGSFVKSDVREVEYNFEFGRSSTQNIIPNNTTTIKACSFVDKRFSHDLISSNSLRVPTDTVGAINVTLFLKEKTSKEEIINIFKDYEEKQNFDVVLNNFEPLVSSDFKKERFTSIIDHRYTDVKNQNMLKLLLWYDNEWGYSSKVIDILQYFENKSQT